MAFTVGDRLRLLKCLNLSKDQLVAGSMLAVLMARLESFDVTNSTALVDEVRILLTSWEAGAAALPELQANDGYKVIDIDGEYRVETHAAGSASSNAIARQTGYVNQILRYLDEHGQLQPFILTGRIIRTL